MSSFAAGRRVDLGSAPSRQGDCRTLPTLADLAARLWSQRPAQGVFIVGLTGGVACGKSTLAESLEAAFRALPESPRVERVATDGFLFANAILVERGILDRKGFPESYDQDGLNAALAAIRRGEAVIPGYSHVIYDVDPALARRVSRPDVLIVEGLGLTGDAPVDTLVYLDASEEDQEAWYVGRFLTFWDAGRSDPTSFYARFKDLDAARATELASMVWRSINRPNLREHIEPVRNAAAIVVRKGPGHAIESIHGPGGVS